jgi:hypothetical protein
MAGFARHWFQSLLNVNSIAPFQPRDARLKWRKKVPRAMRGAPFCAIVEFTLKGKYRLAIGLG